MEEYYQDQSVQAEGDAPHYASLIDDMDNNDINKLDIIHLFGKEKLEDIQKRISKATGLAFVTVDYRGEPITEATRFSKFCQFARSNPEMEIRCKSSDAFGSIQAAVTQKPSVYFCPCGLIEVAIPIVVRGHYLGGFIGGQIRCEDAPENTSRLEKVMPFPISEEELSRHQKLLEEIPVYSYEKFQDVANLVFLIINQLSENEVIRHMQEEKMQKKIKRMYSANEKYLKENRMKETEIMELKSRMNPCFILDTLTAMVNLSLIEDAPRTNGLLLLFTDYIKYLYEPKSAYTLVSRELEHAENYLKIQKEKLGNRLEYYIHIAKNLNMQKIPANILIPFLENAVFLGVMLRPEGGTVGLNGYSKDRTIYIEIEDTGPGMTQEELDGRFERFKDGYEGYYIKKGMENAGQRLLHLFGGGYGVAEDVIKGKGRKYTISWPEHFNERTDLTDVPDRDCG